MNARAEPALLAGDALIRLGAWLRDGGYAFTTVTPATHARVNARPGRQLAADLRDVFGWSRPFARGTFPQAESLLSEAGELLDAGDGLVRSGLRVSSLAGQLFFHSAFPTTQADSVFFGPDTYRFARLIGQVLDERPLASEAAIVDVGCGAGPGGIVAARVRGPGGRLVLADINTKALALARVNAVLAGIPDAEIVQGDLFAPAGGPPFDLIAANPPYLNDASERAYRHGGGEWGEALGVRIVREGLPLLKPGGRLVLYTGCAMLGTRDPFWDSVAPHVLASGWPYRYEEIDPDVFGEELAEPAYRDADRIAALALVVERPA